MLPQTPEEYQKARDKAQTKLDEITKAMGKTFYASKWMQDGHLLSVISTFTEIGTYASLDLLEEPPSKTLICDRLIKAHQDIIDLVRKTVDRLREIRDG